MRTDGNRVAAMFCALVRLRPEQTVQVSNFGDENVPRVSADGLPLCGSDVLIVAREGN